MGRVKEGDSSFLDQFDAKRLSVLLSESDPTFKGDFQALQKEARRVQSLLGKLHTNWSLLKSIEAASSASRPEIRQIEKKIRSIITSIQEHLVKNRPEEGTDETALLKQAIEVGKEMFGPSNSIVSKLMKIVLIPPDTSIVPDGKGTPGRKST